MGVSVGAAATSPFTACVSIGSERNSHRRGNASILASSHLVVFGLKRLLLAAMQFGDLGTVLTLLVALSLCQLVIGFFLEPWLMGSSLNLSPCVSLVSITVWGALWEIPGAFLAVPVTACNYNSHWSAVAHKLGLKLDMAEMALQHITLTIDDATLDRDAMVRRIHAIIGKLTELRKSKR
jgi:hypothetical protein